VNPELECFMMREGENESRARTWVGRERGEHVDGCCTFVVSKRRAARHPEAAREPSKTEFVEIVGAGGEKRGSAQP
jgi:hypothetical protein